MRFVREKLSIKSVLFLFSHITVLIPAQLWGIFFFIQAVWFGFIGLKKGFFKLHRYKKIQVDVVHSST
jgi:hypothetical protein